MNGPLRYFVLAASIACTSFWVARTVFSQTSEIAFNNSAKYLGNGRYDWTVYVDASKTTLARIRSVQYTLDPTFPNPVRNVSTRENKFTLSSNGWGEFTIYAKVLFTDGKTSNTKYRLNLTKALRASSSTQGIEEERKPAVPPTRETSSGGAARGDSIAAANTSRSIGNGRWEWSVFVVAEEKVLNKVQYVEYTLHPTFSDPVQRVGERGSERGKGFALKATGWGTFEIAVKVVFSDARTRFLRHQLKFQ